MYAQTIEQSLIESAARGSYDFDAVKKALDAAVLEHLTGPDKSMKDSVDLLDLAPAIQPYLTALHDDPNQHPILAHKLAGEAVARFWEKVEASGRDFLERSPGVFVGAMERRLAQMGQEDADRLPLACLFASRAVAWGELARGQRLPVT